MLAAMSRHSGGVFRRSLIGSALLAAWLGCAALSPVAAETAVRAAPAVLLADVYRPANDPAAYWVSEKLDGVRAIWNGTELRFRGGGVIQAPDWFTAGLPKSPLDGELWLGRGSFDRLSAIVRRKVPVDAEWRQVRYMVFELPDAPGDFSERVHRLREVVAAAGTPWLQAVAQFRVRDREELDAQFKRVVQDGGEGLMLHRADAPYQTGRSDVLQKLKPWLDAEAVVVGHEPGRGRLNGQLGALLVETPEGRRLRLGTGFSDAVRRSPPPLGATVTYRYRELAADGRPRFAAFQRQFLPEEHQ